MKNKKITKDCWLLIILVIILISLIFLFISVTHSKTQELEEQGLPSLGVWKPVMDFIKPVVKPITTNQTIQNQTETPSDREVFKQIVREYWVSYVILGAIVVLFIGLVVLIFRIYNG